MRRILLVLALLGVAGLGACILWPERLAVNAPMGNTVFGWTGDEPTAAALSGRIQVPDGFRIGIYATGLRNARFLRFTPGGDLLVSQPRSGAVTLLERDADGDGLPDGRRSLLSGLDRPHGIDLWKGWLYVAETDAVLRVRFDAERGEVQGEPERVVTGLPGGGNHWTRTVRVGPDEKLYVAVGSTCNVCEEEDERRAALLRFEPDGSGGEIYARGLRNTVGFAWRPGTGELFGTDNGRDLLGDETPPCELNRIVRGGHYGWPYAYGARVADPEFGPGNADKVRKSLPPAHAFGAHTAPLGITFLRGEGLPVPYRGAALVALHGSWNRTEKQGYEVVSLHWGGRGTITERPFVTGFEVDEDVVGRPVDVAEGPDGAIYLSDDYAGAIYRVVYGGDTPGSATAAAEGAAAPVESPLAGLDPEERQVRTGRGAALWAKYWCAQCHEGQRAAEGVVVVPLEGLSARYRIEDLEAFMAAPTPPMPAYELTEEERRDLAVYLLVAHP